jgi:hypothetical protein
MLNRRTFLKTTLKTGAAAIPAAAALNNLEITANASADSMAEVAASGTLPKLVALPVRLPRIDPATEPWQQRVRRVGQSNMTEHDPAVMNIEEWADYWHRAEADLVFISVTGILAFYPSKVKFHRHGKFLNGRDFFGECVTAARKRGMRVVARMSPDLNWGDALKPIPSGQCGTRTDRFSSAARSRACSRRACSRLIWTISCLRLCAKSTPSMMWIAFT